MRNVQSSIISYILQSHTHSDLGAIKKLSAAPAAPDRDVITRKIISKQSDASVGLFLTLSCRVRAFKKIPEINLSPSVAGRELLKIFPKNKVSPSAPGGGS